MTACASSDPTPERVATATYDPAGPVVAFGDSYTEGTGARATEAYPVLLTRALGIECENAGRLGQTAEEALPRLGRDVLARRPRLVVVEFGVNEAYRGYPVERATRGLDAILTRIRAEGIPVVLVGVRFAGFQENFDATLRELAAKHRTELVLDAIAGLLDDPALRSDAYHPNARGYAILSDRIRPAVERALAR